jgi:hypothetical protein
MTMNLAPSDDTFINSGNPDNNNGASMWMFAGVDGHSGVMRGLIRFAMPAALQGHATVVSAKLTLTLIAFGNGTIGPDHLTVSLNAVTEPWVQGNGVGDTAMTFTVGQMCGDTVSGATWNQPSCAAGTTATWTTAGGTVAAAPSGQVDTTGIAAGEAVVWDSAAAGNGGMVADVQSWIDTPTGNDGWRFTSSDETTAAAGKRFATTEYGGTAVPMLTIVYSPR